MLKSAYCTKQQQQQHIADWQISGLSRTQYCQQHQLNVKTFCNWVSKWKKASDCTSTPPYFIPARLIDENGAPTTRAISADKSAVTVNLQRCSICCQPGQLAAIMAALNLC